MGDISRIKEDMGNKIPTRQCDVEVKLLKSVWVAHVRLLKEDELSEKYVCEPPPACLCYTKTPETVKRDLNICLLRAER